MTWKLNPRPYVRYCMYDGSDGGMAFAYMDRESIDMLQMQWPALYDKLRSTILVGLSFDPFSHRERCIVHPLQERSAS